MDSSATLSAALDFAITPLPASFADRVRDTHRDDFGRAVGVTIAQGGEPLRDQLRRAAPGERIMLCSFQCVPLPSLFAEIGPIFISAEPTPTAAVRNGLPPGYFNRTFALRAYDAGDRIVESTLVEPAAAPDAIRTLLSRPDTACLHARFAGHGCFAARIIRD